MRVRGKCRKRRFHFCGWILGHSVWSRCHAASPPGFGLCLCHPHHDCHVVALSARDSVRHSRYDLAQPRQRSVTIAARVIPKYRKQAVLRIAIGLLALFVAFAMLVFTERKPQKNFGQMIAILLAIGEYVTYVFGCTAWAKAKGYSSSLAIGLIALGMCCFLLSSFILPPVVLFILDDKTLGSRRHSRHSKWLRWIK